MCLVLHLLMCSFLYQVGGISQTGGSLALEKSKSRQEHGLKTYDRLVMDDTMYFLY